MMMAQAARLSLRMQKELKLLLADPPPRASFPFLSPLSDLSSLSTILAQIEGPEGSVYADGVFKIRIQIPERYPFQPPSVAFQTPIYHPNIDNGGRICLDILNLPPKGAWQPSLNISTILTSIGLLLSEPNPDDGLMCEASREYKYNRQAFDEKARHMTQKYAMAGASGSICDDPCTDLNSSPSLMEGDQGTSETNDTVDEFETVKKSVGGFTRKLSLICSSSNKRKDGDGKVNDGCNPWESVSHNENCLDVHETRDEQGVREGSNKKTPDGMTKNSSLALQEDVFQDNDDRDKETVVPRYQSLSPHPLLRTSDSVVQPHKHLDQFSASEKEIVDCNLEKPFSEEMLPSTASGSCQLVSGIEAEMLKMPWSLPSNVLDNSSESSTEIPRNGRQTEVESQNDLSGDKCAGSAGTKRKKLCLGGRQLSLGLKGSYQKVDTEAKENLGLPGKAELSGPLDISMKSVAGKKSSLAPLTRLQEGNQRISQFSSSLSVSSKDCFDSKLVKPDYGRRTKQLDQNQNVECAEEIKEKGPKELPTPDSVIVLDSEDSEDEGKASSTAKSVLARKRIANPKLRA